MATFNKPIATNQGIALLKAQVAGSDSITFTKTVFSSDDYSQSADSDIANLTAIQSMDLTVPAQTFQDVNGNTKVRAIGYNNSVNQAFYIKTYALYAKNKAGNEILFAVASSQTADFVPAFNNAQLTQISYTFTFAIDQTQNITLSDQHEITVTQADIATINNAVNSNASSLTAQQSSYASSLNSAFSSNTSSMNSAFSANSSNASSYVSSASSSLQSQVSSYTGSIASNAAAISSLSNASITYQGKISNFNQGSKQGLYKYFDGTTSSTLTVVQYNDVIIQTRVDTWDANGATFADDDYAPKMRLSADGGNTWSAWSELATQYDVQAIESTATSLANSLAVQNSAISSSVTANSSAIANASNSLASAVNSVSISNNAVSSSIASTVSVNQSNIATNSNAISSLQSSVASNSSAIASNASEISSNATAISIIGSQATSAVNAAMNGLQYRGVWQGGYGSWGGKPDGIYTIDNGQNPIDGFFVDVAKQFTGYGVMTLTTSASGLDRYCIIQDNINQVFKQHLITSTGVYTGWTRLSDNSNSLQYMGNLPSTHLANITQTGIYNMAGITVDDGPYPIQWGQLVVLNSGGVINQTVHDSSGTLFTRSINSWGIVGWNTNKH